jgi:hypothetical protein
VIITHRPQISSPQAKFSIAMASDVATGEKSVLFKSEVQINDTARRLLEVYSSIPAWQVLPHVQDVVRMSSNARSDGI